MRFLLCLLAFLPAAAPAALPFTGAEYADGVPTLRDAVGHEVGEEITAPGEAIAYLRALEDAAPERIRVFEYAESWEGRPLVYAVIARPELMADLDSIRAGLERLSDGVSVSGPDRERMIENLPAVTWLSYGVHGDEISSTDAGLALAYHLLAAEDDERVETILQNSIVVIDPMQNPDGRARFVASFEAARGLEVQGAGAAAERDQPWPGGRYNHALFDLNRDWFALTQPETRGKVQAIMRWNPVVVVDAHEMGSDSTYFFPPAAEPFNPQLTGNAREGQEIIGRANAEAFDAAGQPYFTREVFDAFYPGYGDMWPALRGAVAMTYEQASARGLRYDREDGGALTYGDTVANHFLATLTTAHTVAANKERFLRAYVEDRASAVQTFRGAEDRYTVFDLSVRPGQARALARRLTEQGIEVSEAAPGAELCGTPYEEGAIVVDKAQPDGRLVATLLDPQTALPEDFVAAQEKRRKAGLGHELYDVTAWSMPLMDGVRSTQCAEVAEGTLRPLGAREAQELAEGAFGYAVPWDDAEQARFVVAALKEGLDGFVTDEAFTQNGREMPRGTVVFTRAANGENLGERLSALAGAHGGRAVPMASSWVEEGPNIGSSAFSPITMPKVAMLWGAGTSPLSAGASRYVIERRLGVPVTPIRAMSLGRADLERYDVLLLPETGGRVSALLGARGRGKIAAFARDGGVVVGFGSALEVLGRDDVGLLSLSRERKAVNGDADSRPDPDKGVTDGTQLWSEEDYTDAVQSGEGWPDRVPGVLLNARSDPNHFLSAGYDEATVLFRGNTIYAPLTEDQGTNVFRYRGTEDLLASGYLWEDVGAQLARKPFLVASPAGEGMAIGFTQDPTVRGYLGGLDLMLANAILIAPAETR